MPHASSKSPMTLWKSSPRKSDSRLPSSFRMENLLVFKTSVLGRGCQVDGGCLLTTSVAHGDEKLKQEETTEALEEATVRWVIKRRLVTGRLGAYKEGDWWLWQRKGAVASCHKVESVFFFFLLIGFKFATHDDTPPRRSGVTKKREQHGSTIFVCLVFWLSKFQSREFQIWLNDFTKVYFYHRDLIGNLRWSRLTKLVFRWPFSVLPTRFCEQT